MIRDYKRENPKSQIMMTLKGMGASMASYIMMAPADIRAAEDNAVFMIHNPWSLAIGDYKGNGKTVRVPFWPCVPYGGRLRFCNREKQERDSGNDGRRNVAFWR